MFTVFFRHFQITNSWYIPVRELSSKFTGWKAKQKKKQENYNRKRSNTTITVEILAESDQLERVMTQTARPVLERI